MNQSLKLIIESLLLTQLKPMTASMIAEVFDEDIRPDIKAIKDAMTELKQDYLNRSFELFESEAGYRIKTRVEYAPWIQKAEQEKPTRYSRALLETLAIIAYKQPVTRGDIEDIRGVAVNSHIMKTLLERGWIKSAGHRDVPGKPSVYVTTKAFLDYFNLKNLNALPPLMSVETGSVINEQ